MQALFPQKRPDEASDLGARADDIFVNILSLLAIPVNGAGQSKRNKVFCGPRASVQSKDSKTCDHSALTSPRSGSRGRVRLPNRIMLWAIPVAIAWQTGAFAHTHILRHYVSFVILDHILSILRVNANFMTIKRRRYCRPADHSRRHRSACSHQPKSVAS